MTTQDESRLLAATITELVKQSEDFRLAKEMLESKYTSVYEKWNSEMRNNERLSTGLQEVTGKRNEAEAQVKELIAALEIMTKDRDAYKVEVDRIYEDYNNAVKERNKTIKALRKKHNERETAIRNVWEESADLHKKAMQVLIDALKKSGYAKPIDFPAAWW